MTVSAQIIDVLNDLCKRFGLMIDWSQENVLPYLQELSSKYISWEIATSTAWLLGFSILLIIGFIFVVYDFKYLKGKYEFGIMSFIGGGLVLLAVFFFNSSNRRYSCM